MEPKQIRLRFAPSPTGALHIGGMRTLLLNYFFAKQNKGKLILRIEDTDQKRYVKGAEDYIMQCAQWCGIKFDESPLTGGLYGPYRQSERKDIYKKYVKILLERKLAYYAFDTNEELENTRKSNSNFQYDSSNRMNMKNSLTMSSDTTQKLINQNVPFVIRLKVPENKTIIVKDLIRNEIEFNTNVLDDKVLIKSDGLPSYHFAVVVDDYLMKISHVFRGEEWIPSAPIHDLIYEYLGWEKYIPQWVHLPLILKPDGNGKLSKRDYQQLGIPVYAIKWKDINAESEYEGFKERGFLPEALINFLMLISWNSGGKKEIFQREEIMELFDINRIQNKAARFDYEKAIWINHHHIRNCDDEKILPYFKNILLEKKITHLYSDDELLKIISLTKDRVNLLNDFYCMNLYLFHSPNSYDINSLTNKLNDEIKNHIKRLANILIDLESFSSENIASVIKKYCKDSNLKIVDIQLPLRVILVGSKIGINLTDIISLIGKKKFTSRVEKAMKDIYNL